MKVAFWSFYEENCIESRIFRSPDAAIAQGIFKKWNELYNSCSINGIELVTLDKVANIQEVDAFIFSDFPRLHNPLVKTAMMQPKPKILILEEGPLIHKDNWKLSNHDLFDIIYTWNDDYVDNIKYYKYNVHYVEKMRPIVAKKTGFATMIARNKRAWGKYELYSTRREIIRYFEKHSPESFDLYGQGWDSHYFPSNVPLVRLLNGRTFRPFRNLLTENFPSWRGSIDDKFAILPNYKFCFALENSIGPTGYISEKIWDCFFSGTVPIYYGAPNVTDYIPEDTFIDIRKYSKIPTLVEYLNDMTENEYTGYLKRIEDFLDMSVSGIFSVNYFVTSIVRILKNFRNPQQVEPKMNN